MNFKQHIQHLIDLTPGRNKTERIQSFADSVGCGRTHLYEVLAGTRARLEGYNTLKALYNRGVPAKEIFSQ